MARTIGLIALAMLVAVVAAVSSSSADTTSATTAPAATQSVERVPVRETTPDAPPAHSDGRVLTQISGLRELTSATPQALAASGCVLQREVTEGPYYLDLDLVRRNIKGDRKGTPLTLRFVVVNASTCKPIPGAKVELWHADAAGTYSGVSGNGGNFLRGIQTADSAGRVRFESIFPGWYRGRTPHIHMKVFVGGSEVHTGQVFFRPAVQRAVYRQGVYASRGQADTSNASDNIYTSAGSRALMALTRKGSGASGGYTGRLTIGVQV